MAEVAVIPVDDSVLQGSWHDDFAVNGVYRGSTKMEGTEPAIGCVFLQRFLDFLVFGLFVRQFV